MMPHKRTSLLPGIALSIAFPLFAMAQKTNPESAAASQTAPDQIFVTVANLTGQSRQALLGDSRIDLPIAQRITLRAHPGDTMRIVSSVNSKVYASFVLSKKDEARIITIK